MWKKFLLLCLCGHPLLLFSQRIDELLPSPTTLRIEPALPATFEMGSVHLPADLYAGVIWGTKQDLDFLFKHPTRIASCFIFVYLSGDVIQEDKLTFTREMEMCEMLDKRGFSEIDIKKTLWGSYPVLIAQCFSQEGRQTHLAWVGLNDDEGRWALMFSFHYPEIQNRPTDEQLSLWKHFLADTLPCQ
jgi:hypothetical protein